jgi:hypothetical protein
MRQNVFPDFVEKEQIVLTIEKYGLQVVAAVEDMVDLSG